MAHRILRKPLNLTAAVSWIAFLPSSPLRRRYLPSTSHPPNTPQTAPFQSIKHFSNDSTSPDSVSTQCSELTRTPSLVQGCDYKHWLVVMDPPKGHPARDEIVHVYIKTLAVVMGSEEEAKKSIYSVSTKYYYAFGCKIQENLTHNIKSLPNVRWVLPDSYLCHGENDYGGEPFVDGEVLPYDEKYYADWLRDQNGDLHRNKPRLQKGRER